MDIIEDVDVEDHENETRGVDDKKNKSIQDWQRLAKTEILKLYERKEEARRRTMEIQCRTTEIETN